ncbi:hypothetical protein ACSSS7_002451 [Eimeria intestinalis]
MGNVHQHEPQVEGRGPVDGRRAWQSLVQWPGSVARSRSGSSTAAPPPPAPAPPAPLGAAAPVTATLAPDAAAEASSFSPEEEREELRRRWGETTMYKRLAKELQVFMREALDGVVLVLPMEYADTDAAGFLSAAHPLSCQQQQQQQLGSTAISAGDSAAKGSTVYRSSGGNSRNGSSSATQLLSRFPPAALHYRAGTAEGLKWLVALEGAPDTAYAGEPLLLSFQFFPKYPIDSPELVFVTPFVPLHPHVYSNGHICLSILYDHWSPALGVKACCISLLSMLSSNVQKQAPVDDRLYCQARGLKGPKGVRWVFHDDRV